MEENIKSDELLVAEARSGNTASLDMLMNRYKPLTKSKAKDYYIIGGDLEDLIQEGMIGLYKAVLSFDCEKCIKFAPFATLCVVRQIQTAIKAASRRKHLPLNMSVSLHNEETPEISLDKIPDHRIINPEDLLLGLEAYRNIGDFINENLSKLELNVLMLHIEGKTHAQIADIIDKNLKTVDNALQRIKRKISKGISEM